MFVSSPRTFVSFDDRVTTKKENMRKAQKKKRKIPKFTQTTMKIDYFTQQQWHKNQKKTWTNKNDRRKMKIRDRYAPSIFQTTTRECYVYLLDTVKYRHVGLKLKCRANENDENKKERNRCRPTKSSSFRHMSKTIGA